MGSLRILINSCSGLGGVLVPATQGLDGVLGQAAGWLGSPGKDPGQPAAQLEAWLSRGSLYGNPKKQKKKNKST